MTLSSRKDWFCGMIIIELTQKPNVTILLHGQSNAF